MQKKSRNNPSNEASSRNSKRVPSHFGVIGRKEQNFLIVVEEKKRKGSAENFLFFVEEKPLQIKHESPIKKQINMKRPRLEGKKPFSGKSISTDKNSIVHSLSGDIKADNPLSTPSERTSNSAVHRVRALMLRF